MDLFLKQYKPISLLFAIVCIAACSPRVPPVDQIQQIQEANKAKEITRFVAKHITPRATLYRCNNGKKVEVQRQKKGYAGKKETVIVSFQGSSHQLSSAVTKNGRKYTNIRWTWHEMRNGKAFLSNNTKKTLAANCVKL